MRATVGDRLEEQKKEDEERERRKKEEAEREKSRPHDQVASETNLEDMFDPEKAFYTPSEIVRSLPTNNRLVGRPLCPKAALVTTRCDITPDINIMLFELSSFSLPSR